MALLEALFAEQTLRDPKRRHPAAARWQLCRRILQQGGVIRWPHQRTELHSLARLALDSALLATLTGGHAGSFRLGDIRGYGDTAVQRKIQSRLNNPLQFEPLMAELSLAAWHLLEGHRVTPTEAEGQADLRIEVANLRLPVLAECKRMTSASPRKLKDHITKANRQIKHVGIDGYGVVYVDISSAIPHRETLSDSIPIQVVPFVDAGKVALAGSLHKSVSRLIIVWDEHGFLGEPPDRMAVFLRRHSINIDHAPGPGVRCLPGTGVTFQGSTLLFQVDWDLTDRGVDRVGLSGAMLGWRDAFAFSVRELGEAFRHRRKWQPIELDDSSSAYLFTHESNAGDRRELILALASRAGGLLNFQFAFRLPGSFAQRTDLLTPLESLELATEEYGLNVTLGGFKKKFFFRRRVGLQLDVQVATLATVHNPHNKPYLQSIVVKAAADSDGLIADCAFVFALDLAKLRADLSLPHGG